MFFHSFVVVVLCFPVPVFSPVIAVVGVWPMIVYHQLHLWNYTQVYISVHNRQRSTCTPVSAVHVNIHSAMKVVIEILLWKINVGGYDLSMGRRCAASLVAPPSVTDGYTLPTKVHIKIRQ